MIEQEKKTINNASSALILLQEWLSVSESQICSTEVLSEQLPKVNDLLERSMNEISEHFSIVASNSRKINEKIVKIDESLDNIKNKGKDVNILTQLEKIAGKTSDSKTAEEIKSLAKNIKKQEDFLHLEIKNIIDIIKEDSKELSEIVVGMQFQDRVSQNILITINVMNEIVTYIDKEIENSLPNITKGERKKLLDVDFAKKLIKTLRLGELQLSFVNHLVDHGYINDAKDLDFVVEDHINQDENDNSDGDVDLF